ncbi:MAG: C39 family peptidase [Alphaproteobacteria bacterium]
MRSLAELRHENVVLQNWDFSCGAAALATILRQAFGYPVEERTIAEWMLRHGDPDLVTRRSGFSMLDLKSFLNSRGYEGIGYGQVALDDLTEMGSVLVPLHLNGIDHFVVFRGIAGDRVLFADPAFGNRTLSVQAFEHAWITRTAFVVELPWNRSGASRFTARGESPVVPAVAAIRAALR